jgi:hypothetical protein
LNWLTRIGKLLCDTTNLQTAMSRYITLSSAPLLRLRDPDGWAALRELLRRHLDQHVEVYEPEDGEYEIQFAGEVGPVTFSEKLQAFADALGPHLLEAVTLRMNDRDGQEWTRDFYAGPSASAILLRRQLDALDAAKESLRSAFAPDVVASALEGLEGSLAGGTRALKAEPVSVMVQVGGGVVQQVFASGPVSVLVLDYDVDEQDEGNPGYVLTPPPHGGAEEPGVLGGFPVLVDAARIAQLKRLAEVVRFAPVNDEGHPVGPLCAQFDARWMAGKDVPHLFKLAPGTAPDPTPAFEAMQEHAHSMSREIFLRLVQMAGEPVAGSMHRYSQLDALLRAAPWEFDPAGADVQLKVEPRSTPRPTGG